MNAITIVIIAFAVLGGLDRIIGNRFGLGGEFERAFELLGVMALTMVGMLVIAPGVGYYLAPIFNWFYGAFNIDPSIIPATILANDMGGAAIATSIAKTPQIGEYNAYIVSSMLGTTVSFVLPVSIALVHPAQHKELFLGLLCGIVTVPIGCIVAGLICGIGILTILFNLLPLIIISVIIALGLSFARGLCIKLFKWLAVGIKALATIGLLIGIFTLLTGKTLLAEQGTLADAATICFNGAVTLAGAFPFVFFISRVLKKPMLAVGRRAKINSVSAVSIFTVIVSSTVTFGMMRSMDKRGIVLNSAFAVSASFTLGGHLAFTNALNPDYVVPMIIGKLVSGIAALIVAYLIFKPEPEAGETA